MVCYFVVLGCATPPGYNFTLVSHPTNNLRYSDGFIDITFSFQPTFFMGVEGLQQYKNYNGVYFLLKNKTQEILTIDWNKISFKDPSGGSGNTVMHQGVKYNECSSLKAPSVIPPGEIIKDVIIPCYGVSLTANRFETRWKEEMLPSPRQYPDIRFGVFMPLQIGDMIKVYNFTFRAEKE